MTLFSSPAPDTTKTVFSYSPERPGLPAVYVDREALGEFFNMLAAFRAPTIDKIRAMSKAERLARLQAFLSLPSPPTSDHCDVFSDNGTALPSGRPRMMNAFTFPVRSPSQLIRKTTNTIQDSKAKWSDNEISREAIELFQPEPTDATFVQTFLEHSKDNFRSTSVRARPPGKSTHARIRSTSKARTSMWERSLQSPPRVRGSLADVLNILNESAEGINSLPSTPLKLRV
jgi:hypothetical protein